MFHLNVFFVVLIDGSITKKLGQHNKMKKGMQKKTVAFFFLHFFSFSSGQFQYRNKSIRFNIYTGLSRSTYIIIIICYVAEIKKNDKKSLIQNRKTIKFKCWCRCCCCCFFRHSKLSYYTIYIDITLLLSNNRDYQWWWSC